MKIGEVIRKYRTERQYTQEALAEYLGVTAPAVNKWEKGVTCPDISLLAPLARLLGIDLNELFSFHEDLTEAEIARISVEVMDAVRNRGLKEGFQLASEKIRAYPRCAPLIFSMAVLMDGALVLYAPEKPADDAETVIGWYARALDGEDEKYRNQAAFMLAGKYLQREDCARAQEMLDRLPERSAIDKRVLQAEIYRLEGRADDAATLIARALLQAVTDVQGLIWKLTTMELAAGNAARAQETAELARRATELFELWDYNAPIAPLEIAVAGKDAAESVRLLRQLLESAGTPWELKETLLFHRLAGERGQITAERMRAPLIVDLETNPAYDFMRGDEGFQALIRDYRAAPENRSR